MAFLNKCILCSSDKISFHLRCQDFLVSKEEFDLYRCPQCGFVFTQGYPDEQTIGRYYESDDYISHDDAAKGFLNRAYLLARDYMVRMKRTIVENTIGDLNGNLLDIGCGTGYFAGLMKRSGWKVTGIEPNSKAREFGTIRFGIDVIKPDQISALPDRSFDCITLWHVFEHLHDLFKYSSEIKRLLKLGGHCIAALPNYGSYDADFYGKAWAAYDVPRHLWHFNPSAFRLFCELEGFKINRIRRLPLDVFYISILSERNLGRGMPLIRGTLMGLWFAIKAAFNKDKTSSLIFILKRADI